MLKPKLVQGLRSNCAPQCNRKETLIARRQTATALLPKQDKDAHLRITTLNDSSIYPRWVRHHPPQNGTCNQMLCEPHLMEQPNKNGCQIMTQERKTHADLHQGMKAELCGEGATSSCLANVHTTTTPKMSSIFCALCCWLIRPCN